MRLLLINGAVEYRDESMKILDETLDVITQPINHLEIISNSAAESF